MTQHFIKESTLPYINFVCDSEKTNTEDEYKYEHNHKMEKELRYNLSLLSGKVLTAEYLTLRSSYYSKLNDSESALVDAKQAVQVNPKYSEGYIRLAEIYLHRNMYKTANNVYSHALLNISSTDKNYTLIKNLRNTEERIPVCRNNFMNFLPEEIKERIFSGLSFSTCQELMAVSRSWRKYVINLSLMWENLDFVIDEINPNIVESCIEYAEGRYVRSLILTDRMTEKLSRFVCKNCQYLKTMDLTRCDIKFDSFKEICQSVGQQLNKLSIIDCTNISIHDLSDALELFPELKKLTYKSSRRASTRDYENAANFGEVHKTKVEDLCIQMKSILAYNLSTKIFQHFPWLRILDLKIDKINIGPFYTALNTYCPHLMLFKMYINSTMGEPPAMGTTRLSLHEFAVESRDALMPSILSRLRCLILQDISDLEENDITLIISECTQLETLILGSCKNVTDVHMNSFPSKNQIKMIDVSNCSGITGVGLMRLVNTQGNSLRNVNIIGCKNIQMDMVTRAIKHLGKHVVEY
ncbi:unnamed protein product [Rhizopus stolonifer]